jgi:hypothetical protein
MLPILAVIFLTFLSADIVSDGAVSANTVDPLVASANSATNITEGVLNVTVAGKAFSTPIAPLDYSKMND